MPRKSIVTPENIAALRDFLLKVRATNHDGLKPKVTSQQGRDFLKEYDIPNPQGVWKILVSEGFVRKRLKSLRGGIVWINPVVPCNQMAKKIYKEATAFRATQNQKSLQKKNTPVVVVQGNQKQPLTILDQRVLDVLSQSFTIEQAYECGQIFNLNRSSIDRLVRKLIDASKIVSNGTRSWVKVPKDVEVEATGTLVSNQEVESVDLNTTYKQSLKNSIKVLSDKMEKDKILIEELKLEYINNQIALLQLKKLQ